LAVALASRKRLRPLLSQAVTELASLADYLRRTLPDFAVGFCPLPEVIQARFDGRIQSRHKAEVEAGRELSSAKCPECGAGPGELNWFWFSTPPASWDHLAGRAGAMSFCDRDCREVDVTLWLVS